MLSRSDFNPRYCRKGYATEASNALVHYLFKSVGISVIYADCDVQNVSSWKLLERLGFQRICQLDNQSYKNDEIGRVVVKRGRPVDNGTFWYIDAVEEAMCFGWIDSTILEALQADEMIWENFQKFPSSYQRVRIDTIQIKKKQPELFKSRLQKL